MTRQRWWQMFALLLLVGSILTGCNGDPTMNALDPQGSAGEIQLNLIYWSIGLMTAVFAVVITIYVFVLIRYRKRKGIDRMPKQVHGSTMLEIIWTVIPIACLAALAIPTVKYTFDLADVPTDGDVVKVKVTGYQYWWEFEYPELGIRTAQELYIPTGKKIAFEIHGEDVLHSFWIPALGGKIDVVPGRVNTFWLDAKKPGFYQGKCAELCGAGHALMDFKVYAQTPEDFDKWVAEMKKPRPKTEDTADLLGEKLFQQNCLGCHAGANPNAVKGPDLTKFGARKSIGGVLTMNEENLKKWMKNPQEIKPGTKMPKIDYLEASELDALSKYLLNSK